MSRILTHLVVLVLAVALPACDGSSSGSSSGGSTASTTGDGATRPAKAPQKSLDDRLKDGIGKAIKHVRKYQDPKTGGVSLMEGVPPHPGITAMALIAYMNSPKKYTSEDGPFVRNALEWLVSLQKDDGAIYENDSANYCTSLALSALVYSGEERFQPAIDKARAYIVNLQAREETGYRPKDKFYGGVGYGGDERPDLSNAQFGIEAVHLAKLPKDHAFYKRAEKFLERNQNRGESNDQVWKDADGNEVRPGNDGGAIYMPGESKAGIEVTPDGRRIFRSYGSMSYALLKSYIFCGIDRRDPRVRAVARWCEDNFQLEWHPGFEKMPGDTDRYQGLFYYYYSMAKSLRVFGKNELTDRDGNVHDWRKELAEKILGLQKPNGSFLNEQNARWNENFDVLCTLYATLALEECYHSLKGK